MVHLEQDRESGWDERTNTLTFHTFRPQQQPISGDLTTALTNGHEQNAYRPMNGQVPTTDSEMRPPRPVYAYSELAITVCLLPGETRVGFAMCGGKEECYPSIVNNIIRGSPADRAGLTIGDEIIEVNGISVEQASHAEIVQHIHQCIKSRTIQLRVRRKQSTSPDLSSNAANITDAYLVSVDRDQRKNLEKKLKRSYPGIKTHDMETVHDRLKAGADPLTGVPNGDVQDENQNNRTEDAERERLKQYEDQLRKRKEQDERMAKEREFLRTSLRGSKKLQALEEKKRVRVKGFENECYEEPKTPTPVLNGNGQRPLELQEVLASVDRVTVSLDRYPETRPDAHYIKEYFQQEPVKHAVDVTAAVHTRWSHRTPSYPGTSEAATSATGVLTQLQDAISDDAAELQRILENKHVQAVLNSHDNIVDTLHDESSSTSSSSDQPTPVGIKETPLSTNEDGADLRIVKLFKQDDSYLGATVRQDGDRVIIGRVVKGGVVEKSHLLSEGDELLEVNGKDLKNKSVNQVCELLRNMSGEITFVLSPRLENGKSSTDSGYLSNGPTQTSVRHMRALFDYEPEDDFYVPCKELALQFQKGDIVHVISTSDDDWWQAYREGDDPNQSLAGLIPSTAFQTRREQYNREIMGDNTPKTAPPKKTSESLLCAKRSKRSSRKPKVTHLGKNKKIVVQDEEEPDSAEVLTYEEVSLYLSRTGRKRPIVLVGPPNVGCLELRQRLMQADKDKFAGIVPHTSRPKKQTEVDGVHYHFVSRQQFQEDVRQGKFVEWGEFQKHFYGTSHSSITQVVEKGKTCILTLKAQSLRALTATRLMPFVVFVSPPSLQQLKVQRQKQGNMGVKDEELKSIICEGKRVEDRYGHLFDKVIVNIDLERSFQELRTIIHRLETEPQWVPKTWLDDENNSIK